MTLAVRVARACGWVVLGLSAALCLITSYAFYRQPDPWAAFTVAPPWLWAGIGLALAALAARLGARRGPLAGLVFLWLAVVLTYSDEVRVLFHRPAAGFHPGPIASVQGNYPLRVVTLNCASFRYGNPTADLGAWHPDVVFLQECLPSQVAQIARQLFGERAHFRSAPMLNGIATRFPIVSERHHTRHPAGRINHNVTVRLPDGSLLELANIHLSSAATDLHLWRRDAWKSHYQNRRQRREEIRQVLEFLAQGPPFAEVPRILAGDFNAPAGDPIRLEWSRDFTDAFNVAGRGWGNTFQRRIPILRLDRILVAGALRPVRCRAVTTRHSDHRFVVADFQ